MKVSINWIRDLNNRYQLSADPMPDGIDKLVEKIGAQLGAVDEAIDVGKKYEGVVVAKVVSCEKHPNADKLSVCMIDDGGVVENVERNDKGLVQVVCGAPNVKAGLLVAWIPPGATVPSTVGKDPFILEARELRGVVSNGMLASAKELAIGDSHEGILVIEEAAKPGQPFAEIYGLNDYIIDIENKMFTHRPDLFGMLGIARELAGIQQHVFKSPDWYRPDVTIPAPKGEQLALNVKNDIGKLVPRFTMVPMSNVTVKPSPMWLQTYLSRVGVRPINNIVDITNYVMLETAQPLHAYDYDKVKALSGGDAAIEVRQSRKGEELLLLGGKKLKLEEGAVVIATDRQAIGLGGVMGGAETEVDENTKNIILEAGTFDMNQMRKTAMAYGLFTDAATRFTKGQSPLQNIPAQAKAVEEVSSLAAGRIAGKLTDIKVNLDENPKSVSVTAEFINERLGLSLAAQEIKKLLENVEFKVEISDDNLTVTAPFWRTDIEIPEDLVEEVGRLYGYDHLPLVLPRKDISPAAQNALMSFKGHLRNLMTKAGGNEVLTYSFVHGRLLEQSGQDKGKAYHIRNAISPDLQYYRLSLTPSLLEKVHPNIKGGFDGFALFELGRAHVKGVVDDEGLPYELERLAVVVASKQKSPGAPYYAAKQYAEQLLASELSIQPLKYVPLPEVASIPEDWRQAAGAYEPRRTAIIYSGEELVGFVGEPTVKLKTFLKLPTNTSQLEINIEKLEQLSPALRPYKPLNRFPELAQDINLRVKSSISYEEVTAFIASVLEEASHLHGYKYRIEPIDIYQKEEDEKHKQITWRIILEHPERTLTTEESNKLLDEIAAKANEKFGAERV